MWVDRKSKFCEVQIFEAEVLGCVVVLVGESTAVLKQRGTMETSAFRSNNNGLVSALGVIRKRSKFPYLTESQFSDWCVDQLMSANSHYHR